MWKRGSALIVLTSEQRVKSHVLVAHDRIIYIDSLYRQYITAMGTLSVAAGTILTFEGRSSQGSAEKPKLGPFSTCEGSRPRSPRAISLSPLTVMS